MQSRQQLFVHVMNRFWLRDDERKDPKVLAHLRKENEHCEKQTQHLEELRQTLYKEHLSHLKVCSATALHQLDDFGVMNCLLSRYLATGN